MSNTLLDKFAALEHEQWQSWVRYMLNNYNEENVIRWKRQLNLSYEQLPDNEKKSDQKWARRVLKIITENEKH